MHFVGTGVQPPKDIRDRDQDTQNNWNPHIAELDTVLCGDGLCRKFPVVAVHFQIQADDPAGQTHTGFDKQSLECDNGAGDTAVFLSLGVIDGVRLHGENGAKNAVDPKTRDHQTGELEGDGSLIDQDQNISNQIDSNGQKQNVSLAEFGFQFWQTEQHGKSGQNPQETYQRSQIFPLQIVLEEVDDSGRTHYIQSEIQEVEDHHQPGLTGHGLDVFDEGGVLVLHGRGVLNTKLQPRSPMP